uniref:Muscarinic acetylcholine receptor n=1 Tax=Hucho hucho TaxID=62062 RepID=A0A4W5QQF1_9TELE
MGIDDPDTNALHKDIWQELTSPDDNDSISGLFNFTGLLNETVTSLTYDPLGGHTVWQVVLIVFFTGLLSLVTIIGNILVVVSFKVNRQLKTVNNYFLLSLAVADLIIGVISMNLYTTYIIMGQWALGNWACDLWLAIDYVASNASVMNLLVISFDRYFSITRPLTYRAKRTTRRAGLMIGLAWFVSLVLWAPAILFWQYFVGERTVPPDKCYIQFLSEPIITFCTAIAAFYLPVTIMSVLYWRIYRETQNRARELAGLQGSGSRGRGGSPSQPLAARFHCWPMMRSWRRTVGTASLPSPPLLPPLMGPTQTPTATTKASPPGSPESSPCLPSRPPEWGPLAKRFASRARTQITKRKRMSLVKEKKAAQTLSAILFAFIITWTPYNIMVLVNTFCNGCIPEALWALGYWLCYVNSTVNPMCYALCNKTFRTTFKMILLCHWDQRKRRRKQQFQARQSVVFHRRIPKDST